MQTTTELHHVIEALNQIEEGQLLGRFSHTPYAVAINLVLRVVDLHCEVAPDTSNCLRIGDLIYTYSGNQSIADAMLGAIRPRIPRGYHRYLTAIMTNRTFPRLVK